MYNKRCYPSVPPQECGLELARPYVNRQIYGDTFDPSIALKKEHYF